MQAIGNVDASYCHFVGDAHIMARCEAPLAGAQDITPMRIFPSLRTATRFPQTHRAKRGLLQEFRELRLTNGGM
jgi:hypothetical protein